MCTILMIALISVVLPMTPVGLTHRRHTNTKTEPTAISMLLLQKI
jgi:hypothetical protein